MSDRHYSRFLCTALVSAAIALYFPALGASYYSMKSYFLGFDGATCSNCTTTYAIGTWTTASSSEKPRLISVTSDCPEDYVAYWDEPYTAGGRWYLVVKILDKTSICNASGIG